MLFYVLVLLLWVLCKYYPLPLEVFALGNDMSCLGYVMCCPCDDCIPLLHQRVVVCKTSVWQADGSQKSTRKGLLQFAYVSDMCQNRDAARTRRHRAGADVFRGAFDFLCVLRTVIVPTRTQHVTCQGAKSGTHGRRRWSPPPATY